MLLNFSDSQPLVLPGVVIVGPEAVGAQPQPAPAPITETVVVKGRPSPNVTVLGGTLDQKE